MSRRTIVTSPSAVAVVLLLASISACSTDAASTIEPTPSSTGPASSAPQGSSVATTTESPSTSTTADQTTTSIAETTTTTEPPATTTVAPATTTEPPAPETGLTLAANGVLPFVYGDDDTTVIDGLATAFGAPKFDGTQTFPDAEDDYYLDSIGEEGFSYPIGRTVCFVNDLCAQFGGATADSLTFTGWDLMSEAAPRLFTDEGITVGSVISDFVDDVTIDVGGCYTVGYGRVDGVEVTVVSSGELFGSFDDDGEYILGDPAPSDLTIVRLNAGILPFFLFDDC